MNIKKIKSLSSGKNKPRKYKRATIINELRQKYKLSDLIDLDGIPRSIFYFYIKKFNKPDKYFLKIKEDTDIVVLH
ncbi:hypothetical protein KS664_003249 [Clostridium perfringens]|nr:hypothetical protein [Clostridium perfringens]